MPTSPTPVGSPPTVPDRADQATFPTRMYNAFVYLFGTFLTGVTNLATNAYNNAVEAAASASTAVAKAAEALGYSQSAAASAATAVNAPGTSATSTTSLTIGTGSKTLTIQTGKAFAIGQFVVIANTATPANYMGGQITAHDSGTGSLTVNVSATGGSGTFTAWTVALGVSGGVTGQASSVDGELVLFSGTSGMALKRSTTTGLLKASAGVPAAAVAGTDIKTINGVSPLGSGDISVGGVPRSARTSNTILGTADKGTLVDITSGTFTQTFTAAATLASGWFCYIRNSGTGDITLDPNASETIDGLTSFVMYPGECRLIQCDGSNFYSIVLAAFRRVWTSSGTFYKPPGYTAFQMEMWGGGGGGGKYAAGYSTGGGGGACNNLIYPVGLFSTSETVTVGAGGAGCTVDGSSSGANNGGASTVGSVAFAGGGGCGSSGTSTTPGGAGGGIISSANGSTAGAPSRYSVTSDYGGGGGPGNDLYASAFGGSAGRGSTGPDNTYGTVFGGGGGGSVSSGLVLSQYLTKHGGAGGAAADSSSGSDGTAPGGGGGATRTGAKGGDGARGEVRIYGVI